MKPQINMAMFATLEETDYWGSLGLRTVQKDIKSEVLAIELTGTYLPGKLKFLRMELSVIENRLVVFNN